MKSRLFILALGSLWAVCMAPAVLAADEIELLFNEGSAAQAMDTVTPETTTTSETSTPEAVTAFVSDTVADSADSRGSELSDSRGNFASSSHWNAEARESHEQATAEMAKKSGEVPAMTFAVNVVPEPSAVALAALALVYFLVFGRRYRIV